MFWRILNIIISTNFEHHFYVLIFRDFYITANNQTIDFQWWKILANIIKHPLPPTQTKRNAFVM